MSDRLQREQTAALMLGQNVAKLIAEYQETDHPEAGDIDEITLEVVCDLLDRTGRYLRNELDPVEYNKNHQPSVWMRKLPEESK